MAISIVGFHRSNTSMVARLLARSGVLLGPEEAVSRRREAAELLPD